ncbi:MAG TPA: hypothetical protein VM802_06115 [Chitinophaga sp.]|uniref:hypothetical protein n=1 Tax=Chitinophaga sp. TaxID=1869181 RepID=UPI002B7C9DA2|nr:hypothetical protein [Chitinophaga sp.]HVI44421.1 hypothetical protein [Chitinophaga sp.]
MRRNIFITNFLLPVILISIVGISCKKSNKDIANAHRSVIAGKPAKPEITISGVITSDLVLSNTNNYLLAGLVYVTNNATLTIQPGTWIGGIKSQYVELPGGGLVITRGSKINAVGTAVDPIIFSSNEPNPASGDWAGIILIGNAPTNHYAAVPVEGIDNRFVPADITYGGPQHNTPNDNSGILKYVRIEYAGYELSVDNEINGLTLAGVGNGTILDYIEVYKAKDDAFEFFGGTVNASHLVAVDPLDDMFDTDNGYTGTIAYALGLSDLNRADKSQSNGLESDNNYQGQPAIPYTHPTYYNLTIIGQPNAAAASITNGQPSGTGKYGRAAHLRRNAEFTINNSIFLGFNYGISQDIALPGGVPNTYSKYLAGTSTLTNNYVHAYVYAYDKEEYSTYSQISPLGITNKAYVNANPNASILLAAPFLATRAIRNYVPQSLSPVKAIGAFPTGNTTWANGWTIL